MGTARKNVLVKGEYFYLNGWHWNDPEYKVPEAEVCCNRGSHLNHGICSFRTLGRNISKFAVICYRSLADSPQSRASLDHDAGSRFSRYSECSSVSPATPV